jgi:hypothetical protein
VCVCVCLSVCMCMYVCRYVCGIYIYIYIYIYMYVYMYVCIKVLLLSCYVLVKVKLAPCIYQHACLHTHTRARSVMQLLKAFPREIVCIHTYTYSQTHAHMRAHHTISQFYP